MIIYIGNLHKDFQEDELIETFEEYGIVKNAKIIRDRYTKIYRCFGFIEMANKDAVVKAIEEWNQGSIDDRIIQVKESKFKDKNKKQS